MTLPPCPFGDCEATEPHEHRMVGEGLWGPKVVHPVSRHEVSGTLQIGQIVTAGDGPLYCTCGAEWVGALILPLRPGETRRLRKCDACCELAEAEVLARHRAMFPEAIEATIEDVRLPYRDDTDGGL